MTYYANLKKQKSGEWLVEFPELPGCLSEGSTRDKALINARESLNGWLAANCDHHLEIPEPRPHRSKSAYPVEVDLNVAFAISLRRLRKIRGLTQTQAAKAIGISQQAYARLESATRANPSLSTLQRISELLQVGIELRLVS